MSPLPDPQQAARQRALVDCAKAWRQLSDAHDTDDACEHVRLQQAAINAGEAALAAYLAAGGKLEDET